MRAIFGGGKGNGKGKGKDAADDIKNIKLWS